MFWPLEMFVLLHHTICFSLFVCVATTANRLSFVCGAEHCLHCESALMLHLLAVFAHKNESSEVRPLTHTSHVR